MNYDGIIYFEYIRILQKKNFMIDDSNSLMRAIEILFFLFFSRKILNRRYILRRLPKIFALTCSVYVHRPTQAAYTMLLLYG